VYSGADGPLQDPDDGDAPIVKGGKLWGPVIVDPGVEGHMGAEHGSNNAGELCAIGEVLKWVKEKHSDNSRPVVTRYDSEYAASITQGKYKPKSIM
jgi:ribonuclease HI